jgi:hypothetical protein
LCASRRRGNSTPRSDSGNSKGRMRLDAVEDVHRDLQFSQLQASCEIDRIARCAGRAWGR